VKYYLGKKFYYVFQVFLNCTLQSINLASIVICAQSLDSFIAFMFGKTFALELSPNFQLIEVADSMDLYNANIWVLSLGYLIVMLMCVPMSVINLGDNIAIQAASFVMLIVLIGEFVYHFIHHGLTLSAVPTIGNNYTQLVSIFILSWAYPMLIPSWVNEKKDHVNVNKIVWSSSTISFVGYMIVGILCALAYPNLSTDDVLWTLTSNEDVELVTKIAAYLFSIGIILPGIPVYSITTRYNLYVAGLCGVKQSFFWGVAAPWIVGFVFCQGSFFCSSADVDCPDFQRFCEFHSAIVGVLQGQIPRTRVDVPCPNQS